MFIDDVNFLKDLVNSPGLRCPIHVHTESRAHMIGNAVLDVYHRDYRVNAASDHTVRHRPE